MVARARDYLRVSLDRSGHARSLDEQHDDNAGAATRCGWTLGPSYRDRSISASRYSRKAREGYDQLVSDLESGDFDADILILWESSRGSRRVGEWVLLCDLLAEQSVKVHVTTHSRTYDPQNPRDRRSLLEDAVDSEYESGKMSQRLRRTAAADAAAGKPPTRGAFGHPRKTRRGGKLVAVPAAQIQRERDAVQKTYTGLFAGKTLVSLAKDLNSEGHHTTRGGQWDRTDVRALLLNPRNAGVRYYRGERVAAGQWEAIVSEETWQAAVQVLTDPARKKNHGTARRWLGGGLFQCGQCCASDMRVNYRDNRERVYRCRATGHNTRSADRIDSYVLRRVATRLQRGDVARLLAGPDESHRLAELQAEAAGLRARRDAMGIDYAEGRLTAGQVQVATERLDARLTELNDQIASIGRRNQFPDLLTADDPAAWFLDADLDVQRALIDALYVVTIRPNTRGRWGQLSDTVLIEPRDHAKAGLSGAGTRTPPAAG